MPSPQIWQACDTDAWLKEFIQVRHPDYFSDPTKLKANNGFVDVFTLLLDDLMSCPYQQTCTNVPNWPPLDQSVDGIQGTIVRWAINYMNSWYTAASDQFTQTSTLENMFSGTIVQALDPNQPNPINPSSDGVSVGKVLSMLSSVLSLIPNPYTKGIGGALKFIGTLFPDPKIDYASTINNIIAMEELQASIISENGVAFEAMTSLLASGWQTLFKEGQDPLGPNGMATALQNGGWFDEATYTDMSTNPDTVNNIQTFSYQWTIAQMLISNQIYLHAVIVNGCPSTGSIMGMPGEACIQYNGQSIDFWPVLFSGASAAQNQQGVQPFSMSGFTPKGLTQYTQGANIYANLISGLDQAVTPEQLFSASLQCQLSQNTPALSTGYLSLLNPWPEMTQVMGSLDNNNCLFNLPIVWDQIYNFPYSVLDSYESDLPDGAGPYPQVDRASNECNLSPYGTMVNPLVVSGGSPCETTLGMDLYAVAQLGIVSLSDTGPRDFFYSLTAVFGRVFGFTLSYTASP